MILYFDKSGALKEALNYGPAARAGTTNFTIFAYFEDTDPVAFNTASLRLRKPDLESNMYPSLLMTQETLTFDSSIQESSYFVDGQSYRGFGFDFSTSEYNVILLDTPGLWEGIISLYASHVVAVQGIVTFNVQNGNFITDGTEVDFEDILPSIYLAISEKLSIVDGIVVVPNIEPETVNVRRHTIGQLFYNEGDKNYYILSLVDDQPELVRYSMGNARFFTTALTGTNTMAQLLALTGNDPAFVYIDGSLYLVSPFYNTHGHYYSFSMLKVYSPYSDIPFLDVYKVYNTIDSTTLTTVFTAGTADIVHEKIATEDFVNNELDNYYTKAETYTQTEIDGFLAGKLDYAGKFESSQDSGNTTISQLYGQHGNKPFVLEWSGPTNSGTYMMILTQSPSFNCRVRLFNVQDGSTFYDSGTAIGGSLNSLFSRTFTEYPTKPYVDDELATKQPTLVSGTNIKTINGQSVLGAGNLEITSAGVWGNITGNISDQTDLQNELNGKQDELTAGSNITINNNVISATDTNTTYSAGTGLNLSDTTFSVDTNVIATKSSVDAIEELIPAQATSENQLADKNFVNSSIGTETAYFLGTFNIVTDLGLTTSATHSEVASAIATELASESVNPTNNDYVFVAYPDATVSTEFTQFDRYKYNSSTTSWEWEYTLNNSSFTAEQWAAINSGITAAKIETFALNDYIGSEYDGTASYSVGDLVIYNGKLYRRTDPTTTPDGDFDPTNWAMTDVDTELGNRASLNSDETITGTWVFKNKYQVMSPNASSAWDIFADNNGSLYFAKGGTQVGLFSASSLVARNINPYSPTNNDIGATTSQWRDLYLSGTAYTTKLESATSILVRINGNDRYWFDDGAYYPHNNNLKDLGRNGNKWKDLYLGGSVKFADFNILNENSILKITTSNNVNSAWFYDNRALMLNIIPFSNNTYDLGASANSWKDLYLAGTIYQANSNKIDVSAGGNTRIFVNNREGLTIGNGTSWSNNNFMPLTTNTYDLGSSTYYWKDLYLSGNASIGSLNGKSFPAYPTTNTSPKALTIGVNGNGLSWADVQTYVAGTGIDITSGTISVDSSVVAMQSDLPTGDVNVNLNDSTTTTTSTVALENIVVGTTKYTVTAGMTNPMTTAGDLILGGSSGAPSRLGIGTSGQVLTSNGTTASWQNPVVGMINPMTTTNDIVVGGASGIPSRLPKGSNGDLLRVNSSGNLAYGKGLPYIDCTGANPTYPSADNTDGLIIVMCASEPATKYEGYIYIVKATTPTPSGYEVTFTFNESSKEYKTHLNIYDGQDNTGTLLFSDTNVGVATPTTTVTCTSGYLCVDFDNGGADGSASITSGTITEVSTWPFVFSVGSDGAITFTIDYDF